MESGLIVSCDCTTNISPLHNISMSGAAALLRPGYITALLPVFMLLQGQNLEEPSALAQKSSATDEPGNSTDPQSSADAETGEDIEGDGSDVDGSCSTNPHANNETESHLDSDSSSSDDDAGENKWLPIAGMLVLLPGQCLFLDMEAVQSFIS